MSSVVPITNGVSAVESSLDTVSAVEPSAKDDWRGIEIPADSVLSEVAAAGPTISRFHYPTGEEIPPVAYG